MSKNHYVDGIIKTIHYGIGQVDVRWLNASTCKFGSGNVHDVMLKDKGSRSPIYKELFRALIFLKNILNILEQQYFLADAYEFMCFSLVRFINRICENFKRK